MLDVRDILLDRLPCFETNSGEGASLRADKANLRGVEVISSLSSRSTDVDLVDWVEGALARNDGAADFGVPKSSFLAGLSGPFNNASKYSGANLPREDELAGLLGVLFGEKIPSSFNIRRFAGLYRTVVPGDNGRLVDLRCLDGVFGTLVSGRRKRSSGKSCSGPGRPMLCLRQNM